jgi:hypothetical protein
MNEILAEQMVRERMARFLVFGIRHCGSAPWDGRRSTVRALLWHAQFKSVKTELRTEVVADCRGWIGKAPKECQQVAPAPCKRAGALRMTLIVSRGTNPMPP